METIQFNDKQITFIATAHVSSESIIEVKEAIEALHPEAVCVELDPARAQTLMNPQDYQNTDITKLIKDKKISLFFTNMVMSSYQKRIAKKINVKVGGEMIQAIESGRAIQAQICMIDRDIQITFNRLLSSLSFFEKIKLFFSLLFANDDSEDLTTSDIERMKSEDVLESAINDISLHFPNISKVLLSERNAVMAYNIKQLQAKTIVVVIGAAHQMGLIDELYKEQDITALTAIKPKSQLSKILPWIIPVILVGLIVTLIVINFNTGIAKFGNWVILSTLLATIGATLCFSHPATILVTFLTTFISAISPTVAVGWFAGLSEAHFRKPRVKDFERIGEDLSSLRSALSNRVIHILIVILVTNLMSTIGTLIAGADIIKSFLNIF